MHSHDEQNLKDIIASIISNPKLEPKLLESQLVQEWQNIVGKLIASQTTKMYINQNTLYLYIESNALRQELSYQKDKVKQLCNEFFKREFIEKVIIR